MSNDIQKEAQVSSSVLIRITSETASSIAQWVEDVDAGLLVGSDNPNDIAITQIRDYVTKPKYSNGKKIRGPLADTLEQFLRQEVSSGQVQWDAVIDKRTGPRDRQLDGTIWDAEDIAAAIPPLHPGCRCRRVPIGGPKKSANG